jgi:hypothetical protein
MGNSAGKKTLNMTHNINESTLFEMNNTLNRHTYAAGRPGQARHMKNILSNH